MEITLENLRKFVGHYGAVKVVDSTGATRTLKDGAPDVWELATKADTFFCEGRWHNREEMEHLLDRMAPANVSQIGIGLLEHMETEPKWKK
jgi:hypothetical protein